MPSFEEIIVVVGCFFVVVCFLLGFLVFCLFFNLEKALNWVTGLANRCFL